MSLNNMEDPRQLGVVRSREKPRGFVNPLYKRAGAAVVSLFLAFNVATFSGDDESYLVDLGPVAGGAGGRIDRLASDLDDHPDHYVYVFQPAHRSAQGLGNGFGIESLERMSAGELSRRCAAAAGCVPVAELSCENLGNRTAPPNDRASGSAGPDELVRLNLMVANQLTRTIGAEEAETADRPVIPGQRAQAMLAQLQGGQGDDAQCRRSAASSYAYVGFDRGGRGKREGFPPVLSPGAVPAPDPVPDPDPVPVPDPDPISDTASAPNRALAPM